MRNLCAALRNMKRLKVFTWSYHPDEKARLRVNPVHDEMVVSAVSEARELEHLALRGECAAHVLNGKGVSGAEYPVSWTWDVWRC